MKTWLSYLGKNHLLAASALSRNAKYEEAIQVLEKAAKVSPDSPSLQYALGMAYLRNKQTERGLGLLRQSLPSEKQTGTLNNVAYSLADMNVGLDLAQECGDRSLHRAEAESMLADSPESGFAATRQLGYIWDTVGWIHFRRGEYEKALPYVRASWLLSQDSLVGDHLGQIYAKLGKTQEAAHTYLRCLQHCLFLKVEEVKYVSGSEALKAMDKEIAAMKFGVEFPDVGPARVYRRGMAVCEKVAGCNIVLLLPDSVHAVDQAATPN